MGLFSFRKKKAEDPLGLSKMNLGLPNENSSASQQYGYSGQYPSQDTSAGFQQGIPQPSAFQQQAAYQYGSQQQYGGMDSQLFMLQKNMEVISAKLDSIQMSIQNLSQRISNIEMRMKERSW